MDFKKVQVVYLNPSIKIFACLQVLFSVMEKKKWYFHPPIFILFLAPGCVEKCRFAMPIYSWALAVLSSAPPPPPPTHTNQNFQNIFLSKQNPLFWAWVMPAYSLRTDVKFICHFSVCSSGRDGDYVGSDHWLSPVVRVFSLICLIHSFYRLITDFLSRVAGTWKQLVTPKTMQCLYYNCSIWYNRWIVLKKQKLCLKNA